MTIKLKHFKTPSEVAAFMVEQAVYSVLDDLDRMQSDDWAYYTDEDRAVVEAKLSDARACSDALRASLIFTNYEVTR